MKRALIVCLCLGVVPLAGCKEDKPVENWEKREQVYTDHPPEHWLELLQHRNPQVRRKASGMIIQYGKSQVPALMAILEKTPNGAIRLSVSRTLEGIGPGAEAAVPLLCGLLNDTTWEQRDAAADALGQIRKPMNEIVPALLKAIEQDDFIVRSKVVRTMGDLRNGDARVVAALAKALEDENTSVRAEAADALGKIGPAAKAALPALEQASQTEDFSVKTAVQEAIRLVRGGASEELPSGYGQFHR